MRKAGLFVTLEGGEGSGKTTQLNLVANLLRENGVQLVATREPGGSEGAELLRNAILFSDVSFSPRAEVLIHMAARAEHVERVIEPACEAGQVVLCDRFHHSTIAYQGYGAGLGEKEILNFIDDARRLIAFEPDRTFLLDVPPDIASARVASRAGRTDRYEGKDADFHNRVRQGFAHIAAQEPDRVERIAADCNAELLSQLLYSKIMALLKRPQP